MLLREEIRIRDPFILTDNDEGCYYMYGTTSLKENSLGTGASFSVYKTYDLLHFEEPKVIFDGTKTGFWADRDYWASEVHKYNGKYYLFGSFKAEGRKRGTAILVSDTPDGEFKPISDGPITPEDWQCLDGTFYEEDGVPYIVFCHEWVEVSDGEIWAMPLKYDLTEPVGKPKLLFRASKSGATEHKHEGSGLYVTDGPFLYRDRDRLKMIWSSFFNGKYSVLEASADSVLGKWTHHGSLFDFDGGHAMVFYTIDGKRMISLHAPNKANYERPFFKEF